MINFDEAKFIERRSDAQWTKTMIWNPMVVVELQVLLPSPFSSANSCSNTFKNAPPPPHIHNVSHLGSQTQIQPLQRKSLLLFRQYME